MNTQNPARTAVILPDGKRVQPDCPLSGAVKRGGFTLDTSGSVAQHTTIPTAKVTHFLAWPDLTPFEQGYVEALFASLVSVIQTAPVDATGRFERWAYNSPLNLRCGGGYASEAEALAAGMRGFAFRHLAPETLATIRRDCARFENYTMGLGIKKLGEVEGRRFFNGRQSRELPGAWGAAFPPVPISIGDDGKVSTRAAA